MQKACGKYVKMTLLVIKVIADLKWFFIKVDFHA